MKGDRQGNAVNPFTEAVAIGTGAAHLARLEWERQQKLWRCHVEACRSIMKHAVLSRLELAAEAARAWGHDAIARGIHDTTTHTGLLHLRAELKLSFGHNRHSRIEFIGSPTSMVIGIEGERVSTRKRWPKMAFSAEAISTHADTAIRDFLRWGVVL
jgi:hypothetical protein